MGTRSIRNNTYDGNSCQCNRTFVHKINENCHLLSSAMKLDISDYNERIASRNVKVDVLAILFGIGSWISVTSMFVQIPLIIANAPEGWSLPSYLSIIIQLGNVGPLCYMIFQKYSTRKLSDSNVIYVIYLIGCSATILMAFLYKNTVVVGGQSRSVALLALGFCLALVGCTSSVLFMPYMGRFRAIYLVTYLIGEGLGGFLSSIMALIQGIGGAPECKLIEVNGTKEYLKYTAPPRFDTKDFFILVFMMMIVSGIAFILLDKLQMCKKQYVAGTINYGNDYLYDKIKDHESNEKNQEQEEDKVISSLTYKYLMLVMAIVSLLMSGVFPGIQSYSCLPYGYRSYHLTATLTAIANPLACFIALFLKHTSIRLISMYFFLAAVLSVYLITTAAFSPTPPLVGKTIGEAMIVLFWTLVVGIISYIKLSITSVLRFQGGKSLVWCGLVSQIGSAIGALITFFIVNYTYVFVSYDPSCPYK